MIKRGIGIGPLSEQFVRTVYGFEAAGMHDHAVSVFQSFVEAIRRYLKPGKSLEMLQGFRLATAQVLVNDVSDEAGSLLHPDSFAARIAGAWQSGAADAIEACFEELEHITEILENEDLLAPWDDVWHYVLLSRLRVRMAQLASKEGQFYGSG